MIKLFTDEGWPNFSEEDGILSTGAPIIFIWGGRGTGKTYGALKHVHVKEEEFLYLRRTPQQAELICSSPLMWPWSPLNNDLQTHYAPFKMSQIAGMYEVGNAGAYTDTGVPIRPAQMSGVLGNVVTMARTRGFSSPNTSIIILDEYQKEESDYYRRGEGVGLANIYETVNRNRELQGQKPITLLCMSNAVGMANPYYMQWDITDTVERMIGKKERIKLLKDKGILLIDLVDSPVAKEKAKTALYRSMSGTDFYRSAIENQYSAEEKSLVVSRPLREYYPLVQIGRCCIYEHKSKPVYYVCRHRSGDMPAYGSGDYERKRFRAAYGYIWPAYLQRQIEFERYSDEIFFREYCSNT